MNIFCENEKLIDLKNWNSKISAWIMHNVLLNVQVENIVYTFNCVTIKNRLLIIWTRQKSICKIFIQKIFVFQIKQYVNFDQSTNVMSIND